MISRGLTPSPFLDEVRRACGRHRSDTDGIESATRLPTEQTLWSPREQRLRAIDQALNGSTSELARLSITRHVRRRDCYPVYKVSPVAPNTKFMVTMMESLPVIERERIFARILVVTIAGARATRTIRSCPFKFFCESHFAFGMNYLN